jgi:hypothetical protein
MMRQIIPMQIRAARAAEARRDAGPSVVLFEAPTLPALAADIAEWAWMHPTHTILSLSHARETRSEDRASLAGPAHIPVYTGLLVVSSAPRALDISPDRSLPHDLVPSGR